MSDARAAWSVACHMGFRDAGAVALVHYDGAAARVTHSADASGGSAGAHPPVFLGADGDGRVILMDPVSKAVRRQVGFPAHAFAAYAYHDLDGGRTWFMNDGDPETGCDALNCGTEGSSVTVVECRDGASERFLKTLCVGRGHHVTTFVGPSAGRAGVPRRAFVSNLMDGTISVIGNDPADAATFLEIVATINLCEPAREEGGALCVPNGAFPHGKGYSPATGRLYNLNNGYQTVAVIDPVAAAIVDRIALPGCSNLLPAPDGRFLIGKGADRKADPAHVMGRLAVVDAAAGAVVAELDLPDVYPSAYRFTPDGRRLYVTTAATGKGAQRANLRKDVVLVYDTAALPRIELAAEIAVGEADCGRRPIAFFRPGGAVRHVLIPNPTDATLSIADGVTHRVLETARLGDRPVEDFNFSLRNCADWYGC